jgi:hypothetical protein
MTPKKIAYIGEHTGDNMQVAPTQLLEMIADSLDDTADGPVKGMLAVVVREDENGTLHLDAFRCGLPKFVEIAVLTRQWHRVCGVTMD